MRHPERVSAKGIERENLREKGQFWTPDWIANAMVEYALSSGSDHLFDPAVGTGAFLRAAKRIGRESLNLMGTEIYPDVLQQALYNGLSETDLRNVDIRDFVIEPPPGPFKAIVANPPYIRHHRLSACTKRQLRGIAVDAVGSALDGRAGLHIYFLIRALRMLDSGGRLAFIMPSDTCEGVFSSTLWNWIIHNYRLDAVVTFAPEASPFLGVDTNPMVFMIANETPREEFQWAKCHTSIANGLRDWINSGFENAGNTLEVQKRSLSEGLSTGLSRPQRASRKDLFTLGEVAHVVRGIATGANRYFFLTAKRADSLQLPGEFLIPAIGRTRDVPGGTVDCDTINDLESKNRPTLLFSPDGRPLQEFPSSVREYLLEGESGGIHLQSLISTRRPWYKMETRTPPPILFAYLGRRNARFIRNLAGVVPLTGFLCVYPNQDAPDFIERLWEVLQEPETIANLSYVGKSYGSGAIKVEPRALEKLPLPFNGALTTFDCNKQAQQTKML